ncbi:MAG TPA: ATP-binding protein [Acidimicrobiales bacterium]|nr:ATP-binding protein [Acidimicrobiales bacterium]
MPALAAQYQFAAAFTVFLVALAGIALVALRADPLTPRRWSRAVLALGFAGIGTAAFLQGSLLLEEVTSPIALALRVAGAVLLVGGSVRWQGTNLSRALLWAGTAALLAGGALDFQALPPAVPAAVKALGGLLIGAALLGVSRRAIAARVAASAAATLLLVVLVLSVALSAVLANTVEDQALGALDGRAVQEASAIENRGREAIKDAAVAAALLTRLTEDPLNSASPRVLPRIDEVRGATDAQAAAIESQLRQLSDDVYTDVAFAFVDRRGGIVAAGGLPKGTFVSVAGSPAVTESLASSSGRVSVEVLDGQALTVGVSPLNLRAPGVEARLLGAVVAAIPLDDTYLQVRAEDGDRASLSLVTRTGVVASAGRQPRPSVLSRLAGTVLGSRAQASEITGSRFAAARPVRAADNRPVVALVASRPTTAVEEVRRSLFQTFFVIAFGGTVLALLLATLVGDRIGSGIRRLTLSAEAIQRGRTGVRSGLRSMDEVGVLGTTFDSMAESIEEKTAALRRAADEEAQLRSRVEAIVAGMGEALVALDAEGRITDFNTAAEYLLRLKAETALGQYVGEVVRARSEDGVNLASKMRYPEPRWSALADLKVLGGDEIPVAVTAGALRGPDGSVAGAVIVLRDLRGEREVERMKRHFLSRVGHELRTPLTPLIGYTQLLAGRPVPPERARVIYESMLLSARRLERIVEMLEFFASLDAGRDVLQPEVVDLRVLLNEVVAERQAKLDGDGRITRRIGRDLPAVEVDRRWLARSIDELLDNAIKFSPAGSRVTVSAGRSEAEPDMVEISVRDAGVGMSVEQMEQAFTPWAQGDESDTRPYGGLGLGLALVQRVTERHGGKVECRSSPRKGSRFSILLPYVPTSTPDEEIPPEPADPDHGGDHGAGGNGVRNEGAELR